MRIVSISYIRLVATLMIVLCHLLQYYGNRFAYFFNVGVQIFFLVSGFLYGTKDVSFSVDWFKRRFIKIATPYYILVFTVSVIYLLFARADFSWNEFIRVLTFTGDMKGIEHLWFVPYILFCYLITPYLKAFSSVSKGGVILSILLYNIIGVLTPFQFHVPEVDCYIFGFIMANRFQQSGWKKELNILCVLSLVLSIAMNLFRLYARMIMHAVWVEGKAFYWFELYSHMMMGLALFTLMLICFDNLKDNSVLNLSDKYSYEVYLVHHLFLLSPVAILQLPFNPIVNCILSITAIVVTAWLLKLAENKILKG